ncbi:hypothetical protein BH23PLA1_BH23PLA1_03030 [soil metagenome]
MNRPHLLPERPELPSDTAQKIRTDFDRFASQGLPRNIEAYLLDQYGLDVSASYAGRKLRNPWGKASGQLSMRLNQIEEAAEAGLGFVVLKTVIAQDAQGGQSMGAWAIKEARMVPERIVGASGAEGWTITWKGRGWWDTFDAYLNLVRKSTRLGQFRNMLIIPSIKYHLPAPGETGWRVEEYEETTSKLLDAYEATGTQDPMLLEKDFSPTLAGSDRSAQQAQILDWLATVPALIRQGAGGRPIVIGLKLFNALFDDDFQLEMLRKVHEPTQRPDFLIYANRLFDPDRVFEGHRGVAFGGPDLSDRNLRILSAWRSGRIGADSPLEISATGDIGSGRLAVEYALRGSTSFQIHTFFQLPAEVYTMTTGSKLQRALHRLYFDPEEGFVPWILHTTRRLGIGPSLLELAAVGASKAPADLADRLSGAGDPA